jgi:hypothetical protein
MELAHSTQKAGTRLNDPDILKLIFCRFVKWTFLSRSCSRTFVNLWSFPVRCQYGTHPGHFVRSATVHRVTCNSISWYLVSSQHEASLHWTSVSQTGFRKRCERFWQKDMRAGGRIVLAVINFVKYELNHVCRHSTLSTSLLTARRQSITASKFCSPFSQRSSPLSMCQAKGSGYWSVWG